MKTLIYVGSIPAVHVDALSRVVATGDRVEVEDGLAETLLGEVDASGRNWKAASAPKAAQDEANSGEAGKGRE